MCVPSNLTGESVGDRVGDLVPTWAVVANQSEFWSSPHFVVGFMKADKGETSMKS